MIRKTPEAQKVAAKNNKELIKTANDRFGKTFKVQFFKLFILSKIGRIFFPVFSVGLGLTFISFLINQIIGNIYISFGISFTLLAIWEYTKAELLINSLEVHFSGHVFPWVLVLVTFIFQISSFFISIQGAKELYEQTDHKTAKIKDFYKVQSDSLAAKFDLMIAKSQNDITSLQEKARGQWNGINTPEQYKQIELLRQSILSTQEIRERNLADLKKDKNLDTDNATKKAGFNIVLFMIISGIIEILICLSGFFVIFYDMKIKESLEDADEYFCKPNETYQSDINNIFTSFINYVNQNKQLTQATNVERRKAGFNIGNSNG